MIKNVCSMYTVKPLYDYRPNISLPTCMYKMNNLMYNDSVPVDSYTKENFDLASLEKAQLNIIKKLEDLKAKVVLLKEDFGIKSENVLSSFQDIVIKANPQNPPISLWVFYNLFSQSMSTRLVTHMHSSLTRVPDEVQKLKNISDAGSCQLSLTVIWRKGNQDHEMMISPVQQGIIEGEVNIARYLSRLLAFNYDSDAITSTVIDNWLETAQAVIHGNNKDKQGALKSLNSHLGKNAFLVGDSLSLADIVMWSGLVQTKSHQGMQPNIAKWFKSLLSMDAFKNCTAIANL